MEWNGHHFRNITLNTNGLLETVRPDSAIYWTLEKFLKPLETINLNKSHTFLGNFCKDIKIYHFSSEIIDIWQLFSGLTGWKPKSAEREITLFDKDDIYLFRLTATPLAQQNPTFSTDNGTA